ncbi:winged helix-turn-helix domain-containing protein [Nitrosopumilus ureiphilus]|uniref:Transcriptional regulator n=1 Tax=Nitrosopumilus ureiphilus TaxID=1470067 RepID=A0A7D5M5B0_9ARCH|nr:winged helix-turn-helix domain-containing protein [Nitrosopumilus ureiphilus]QLH07674.1 transcriptional regulator [Nitrosopumilus ureiphilus]
MTKSDILLGYIKASSYRTKIIKALEGKKLTPAEMAKETNISLSHVSNTLAELVEKNLIVCLNPEFKKGRLYELTSNGKKILKNLV